MVSHRPSVCLSFREKNDRGSGARVRIEQEKKINQQLIYSVNNRFRCFSP